MLHQPATAKEVLGNVGPIAELRNRHSIVPDRELTHCEQLLRYQTVWQTLGKVVAGELVSVLMLDADRKLFNLERGVNIADEAVLPCRDQYRP